MSRGDISGVDLAGVLLHLTKLEYNEAPRGRTLSEYVGRTSHITHKVDVWREAAVYLAVQVHSLNAQGDIAVQQDAGLALAHIKAAVAEFDRRHPGVVR